MVSSFVADFALVLIIGLVVSLLISEIFGVSPGGIITPAYLAMSCDSLQVIVVICLISIISYLLVEHVLSRFMMLYGRRKFVAFLLVAVTLKLIMDYLYPVMPYATLEFRGIGMVVPALLANQISKQGTVLTLGATVAATVIVFLLMNLFYLLGL